MSAVLDPFGTLGLAPTTTKAEVTKAYRKLALQNHPDKAGPSDANEEKMKEINNAFELINEKNLYDTAEYEKFRCHVPEEDMAGGLYVVGLHPPTKPWATHHENDYEWWAQEPEPEDPWADREPPKESSMRLEEDLDRGGTDRFAADNDRMKRMDIDDFIRAMREQEIREEWRKDKERRSNKEDKD
ncbi:hypothetical protein OHC33_006274 [Knufia fluminis]|uniref:J domain-containing protein n=1 Tax=Knufia fluminis TaxID=191047 RepID=A0AAN8I3I1_9EURO|nr:hypothetical protein OHC33_006274 [Knufia fluminis]